MKRPYCLSNRTHQTLLQRYLVLATVTLALVTDSMFGRSVVADEVDVYLLGGQSNMQGIGKLADLPEDICKPIPNTFIFQKETFEPLVVGTTKTSKRAAEFGPEIGIALEVANSERTVYLIKYAASGMPLHHGWNGNKWVGGEPKQSFRNFYPGLWSSDKNPGQLYQQMVARFRAGLQKLREDGHVPVIQGFAWMQGEQDSKNAESASTYSVSLNRLCARLAEDMQTKRPLCVAYGQVLPHEPALPRFTHRVEVREQMAQADADSGHANRIANAKMVSTDGFSLLPDTVHYDAAGQLKLGRELGKAMLALQR